MTTAAFPLGAIIPGELRDRKQWVAWDAEKKPHCAPGKLASSTDPSTWLSYAEAVALVAHGLRGVGYVFAADDPYCGIDFDKCRREDGTWDADVLADVTALDSYTEVSQSGKGLHVIVRASLDGLRGNRRGQVELYDRGRYFALTGDVFDGRDAIHERQLQVSDLHARRIGTGAASAEPVTLLGTPPREATLQSASLELLMDRIRASERGFFPLFDAGETRPGKSASESDLTLACLFAKYSRDPQVIAQLMNVSALKRPKWREQRPTGTILELAIREALLKVPASATSAAVSGPQVFTLAELKARPDLLKPREAVAHWLAYRRRLVLLAGREKAGKSTLLTAAVAASTTARDFLNAPTVSGPVLWVSADREDEHDIIERAERFGVEPTLLHVLYPGAAEQRLAELDAVIAERQPVWVIIDTLASFAVGLVERASQSDQWPLVLLPLRQLAHDRDVAITISAHARKEKKWKSGGYRDSTAIGALVDMILEMERDANQPQWRQIATYGRWTLGDVVVELQHDGYRLVSTTEAAAASPGGQDRRRTLEAMGEEEWCAKDLGAKLGISKDTAQRRLLQLLAAGKVRVSGTGKRGMKLYLCVTPHQDLGQGTAATAPVIRGGAVAAVGPLSAERPHAEVCGGAADGDAERKPSF